MTADKIMLAYKLKNHLEHLTLAGYEDGEYQWIGKSFQWDEVERANAKHEHESNI